MATSRTNRNTAPVQPVAPVNEINFLTIKKPLRMPLVFNFEKFVDVTGLILYVEKTIPSFKNDKGEKDSEQQDTIIVFTCESTQRTYTRMLSQIMTATNLDEDKEGNLLLPEEFEVSADSKGNETWNY